MPEPSLPNLYDITWQLLESGQRDRNAAARLACLASLGTDGTPQARMVVLRRVDRVAGEIDIHTDVRSAKMSELSDTPAATLVIWDPASATQLRLSVIMTSRPGTQTEWDKLPVSAQQLYGGTPKPGAPLSAPAQWQPQPDQRHFRVLTGTLTQLEFLRLAPDRHLRAEFCRANNWQGQWIAP